MALGIEIAGEKLQLFPGTEIELEEFNPFLQFTEEGIKGGISAPFDTKNTPRNLRLLQYAGIHQKKITSTGIDAMLYDGTNQASIGKVKIEKPTADLNNAADGRVSCYFLGSVSSFFQDIKDKKLREMNMGGVRSFEWDGLVTDTGTGFWRHIHLVANGAVNAYDYAFYPVMNSDWVEYDNSYPPEMNRMLWDPTITGAWPAGKVQFPSNITEVDYDPANRIVPFPYLHYVLKQIFTTVGWTLHGEILDDATFKKITMLNFRAINWAKEGNGTSSYYPNDPVEFNLADHLPNKTVSSFLIQLANRMGWFYHFERASKKCTIKFIKDAATGTVKDLTEYADPVVTKNLLQNRVLYALRTNDGIGGGRFDTSQIDYRGLKDERSDLPAADDTTAGQVWLVVGENNYYICESDGTNFSWQVMSPNLFDYDPGNATEEITTEAGTVGVEVIDTTHYDLVPRLDQQGIWVGHGDETEVDWGIHLLFNHGLVDHTDGGGKKYCYASNHIYDANMNQVADWGLTFTCYKTDGTDVGLYATFWKAILELLKSQEEIDVTLNLPRHVYLNLDYTDQIVVAGVKMFMKKRTLKIPYKKNLQLNCLRI
jgi:hypothetical protein